MNIASNSEFDSMGYDQGQRLDAFARFSNNGPVGKWQSHSLERLSSDAPDIHRVTRHYGEEITMSKIESTGYSLALKAPRPTPKPAAPVSVCLLRAGSGEVQTPDGLRQIRAGDVYISTTTACFTLGPSCATRLLVPDDFRAKAADVSDRVIVIGGSTPLGQLLATTISSVDAALSSQNRLHAVDPLNQIAKDTINRVLETDRSVHPSPASRPLNDRVRSYLMDNLADTSIRPKDLADYLGMSRASLYRAFQNDGGVMAFVTDIRLDIALTVLSASGCARGEVTRIAYLCGFKSASHFSQAFRKKYGVPPSHACQIAQSRGLGPNR